MVGTKAIPGFTTLSSILTSSIEYTFRTVIMNSAVGYPFEYFSGNTLSFLPGRCCLVAPQFQRSKMTQDVVHCLQQQNNVSTMILPEASRSSEVSQASDWFLKLSIDSTSTTCALVPIFIIPSCNRSVC
jgi:hypothetical protein